MRSLQLFDNMMYFITLVLGWLTIMNIGPARCFTSPIIRSASKINIRSVNPNCGQFMTSNRSSKSSLFSANTKVDEEKLDSFLESANLQSATSLLKSVDPSQFSMTRDRFVKVFDLIEEKTRLDATESQDKIDFLNQESNISTRDLRQNDCRYEMTEMYETLKSLKYLSIFGAAANEKYPAAGSKEVTPVMLQAATGIPMEALTPQTSNTFLWGGAAFAFFEGCLSLATGIDFNFLVVATLVFAGYDKFLLNGGIFETVLKTVFPIYREKVLRHEAGHFLIAYLLGCPVEGCVLSAWAALSDARFGGSGASISAGTSFYDPVLSTQINDAQVITRSSIDRYSCVVMGGIAAEAVNFGKAEGGAGDEMALIQFLLSINPKNQVAKVWDENRIRFQARWGAVQAVLLLKQFKPSYDALVDALERGGKLGECIYAIEKAAMDNKLEPLSEPIGIFKTDDSQDGYWETDNQSGIKYGEISNFRSPEEEKGIDPEILKKSTQLLEERLRAIDKELKNLN